MENKINNKPSTEGKAPDTAVTNTTSATATSTATTSTVTSGMTPENIVTVATALSQLPEGYLKDGYYIAGTENPDARYVASMAKEIAKKLAPMEKRAFEEMYQRVRYTNRFDFAQRQLEINRLVPLATKLVKKGKAPAILLDFCKANAAAVKTLADSTYFLYHMEAVYCYME